MTDELGAGGMTKMRIYVVPYDPTWVAKFEAESAYLAGLLAPWRAGAIEHIGSTAIVGLCAKPVIDVMVGVTSLADSEPAKQVLSEAGYQYSDYKADEEHWFCKPSFAFRTHHVHLIPQGSRRWLDTLEFRDRLRSDPKLAVAYAALKLELAQRFEFDRDAYTEAKGPFIGQALGRKA